MEAKYIKFEDRYGNTYIVIFSNFIIHFDMARKMHDSAISAGFVRIDDAGKAVCYGESTSLGLKSEDEDTVIANRILGQG